jgi:hypothetical protein
VSKWPNVGPDEGLCLPAQGAGCAGTAVQVPGSMSPLHNPFKVFITEQKTSFLLPPVRKVGPEQKRLAILKWRCRYHPSKYRFHCRYHPSHPFVTTFPTFNRSLSFVTQFPIPPSPRRSDRSIQRKNCFLFWQRHAL